MKGKTQAKTQLCFTRKGTGGISILGEHNIMQPIRITSKLFARKKKALLIDTSVISNFSHKKTIEIT